MNNLYFTTAIVIILLVFLYRIIATSIIMNTSENLIYGFWQAHPAFCDEANIDMFCIYLEPGSRNMCWILIVSKNDIITNHFTTYSISSKWWSVSNWSSNINTPKDFEITFKELPNNMKHEFPLIQNIKFYMSNNKLILSKGKRVYFVGYKDSKISDLIDIESINTKNDEQSDPI